MAAKSIRKSVSFDDSDVDRALLDAIATHQSEQQQTFSDLCKQALRQYLLESESPQSMVLFMELQTQISQLATRVATLEAGTATEQSADSSQGEQAPSAEPADALEDEPEDPVLTRLGPLLDDF